MPKLLIVDDEEDVRDIAKMYFSKRNIDVLATDSGDEAVRMVGEERPDLVILDFNLPDISGAEVLKKIREDLKSDVKVMMMTGMDEGEIKKEVGNLDVFRYLFKPLTLDVLEKIVLAELNV